MQTRNELQNLIVSEYQVLKLQLVNNNLLSLFECKVYIQILATEIFTINTQITQCCIIV